MDDVFKDAMKQVFREAPPELVEGFRKKLVFIQRQNKHCTTTVQSCLDGMADPPTFLELLTAAYVVNGGLLFKHVEEDVEELDDDNDNDDEYKRLLREMDELNCTEVGAPPAPTPLDRTEREAKGGLKTGMAAAGGGESPPE